MFIMTTTYIAEQLLARVPQSLLPIAEKVLEGKRLEYDDAVSLLHTEHLEVLRLLADYYREMRVGSIVYHASTLYIHPTNLCELSCPMCSYYAKPGWKTAWFTTPEQIEAKVRETLDKELTEIHFVGGLWRDCNLDYYQDAFSRIKQIDPNLHIKALTPVEYDFLAKMHGITVEEVFDQMISWGLGSLPGGGAEILVEEIRKKVAPGKITSDEYLNVHRLAHKKGLRSNITMLFGHIEEPEHIATHLMRIRELQDETGGFQTFVPLKYHVENNALGKRKERLKPKDIRRIYAVSRLMLDNVRNLKVLWNYVGLEEAKEILHWGANDIAATSLEEKIVTMAGGVQVTMTSEKLAELIKAAGRIPKKIHSGYNYCLDDKFEVK
jgi:CofH subfamily radical SAM domain protein